MASLDVGNYNNRRMEGMLNIPIVGDKLDLRVAGEWTKRDGYAFNEATDHSIDGRDLWSGRVSLLVHPVENLTANFVWEHFSEDDDRARSTKQLCTRDNGPSVIDGPAGPQVPSGVSIRIFSRRDVRRGLSMGRLRSKRPAQALFLLWSHWNAYGAYIQTVVNPYAGLNQSQDLRVVDSLLDPKYRAKNDTFELNTDYNVTPTLTLTSQTGFNKDMLNSTEDYNRFNTTTGIFLRRSEWVRPIILSEAMASFAIRNWDVRAGWSARIFPRSAHSNSRRNCGWHRISAARSISALAPTICTIRRLKIIMSL